MNSMAPNTISGIKSKDNKYIAVSQGYANICQFENPKSMIGITNQDLCQFSHISPHCSPETMYNDFIEEDEYVLKGNSLFIFDCLYIHDQLIFALAHKSPYITHKTIDGTIFHGTNFDVVNPNFIKTLLSNQDIRLSSHTKKHLDIYKLAPSRKYKLTNRELQCIKLLTKGLSAKVIAFELGVSKRTIDCHFSNIKDKLNVKKTTEIVAKVLLEGIV